MLKNSKLMLQRGFTLIEMMVVIFIIGIMAGLVTLSVGQSQTRVLQDELHRLQSLLALASDEAVLQAEEVAVEVYRNGYRFMQLAQSEREWEWQPMLGNDIFRPRCFPDGVELSAEIEGEPAPLQRIDCAAELAKATATAEKLADVESKSVERDKFDEPPARIFILSSGELTPFELTLTLPDKSAQLRLGGDITGKMSVQNPNDDKARS